MRPFRLLAVLVLALLPGAPLCAQHMMPGGPTVAILVFEGVQIIDFTGPYEVFGQAGFSTITVAPSAGPIHTSMGLEVTPSHTFANAPEADILLLPGGDVDPHLDNPQIIAWVKERAAKADHVISVCNGAFFLAKAGLLDGLTATTFYDLIPRLKEAAPKARIVSDQRYVDNGKIVTTAGLSSGIDGSLYLIEKIKGRGLAQQAALNMEHDWRPGSGFARASFADRHLRSLFGRRLRPEVLGGEVKVVSTQGDKDRWEARWEIKTQIPLVDLQAALALYLTEQGKWVPKTAGSTREWRFTDEEQKPWNAWVELEPAAGAFGEYRMAIRVERAGA
ncbi:MAG TPA: DJ-1/PfpI family protein [Thermoanaerobaculia bacterium]|nr:DJ-1/PfpI family protein [Thermoanaerobaculia bacterium]